MLHNSETWNLKKIIKNNLYEMGCSRKLKGIMRRDCVIEDDVRADLEISLDVVQRIQQK